MKRISEGKLKRLKKLSTDDHIISALAIDQRGSLKKMFQEHGEIEDLQQEAEAFKVLVSEELTPYASSILLDPEYGLPACRKRSEQAGLLLAYEQTGYNPQEPGRLPKLISNLSVRRIRELGADAVKFLLYYDPDEDNAINEQKRAFVERIGSECRAEDMVFFLEIVTYDATLNDTKGQAYAKLRPHKVIQSMKIFSEPRYDVDVLKVEVPINMNFVAGYAQDGDAVYSRDQALKYFREQDEATLLPYIFLSGGVSAKLFQETLLLAKEAGSTFNGVLCGRATWKDAVPEYVQHGPDACRDWLRHTGRSNIESLNQVLVQTASPWTDRIGI